MSTTQDITSPISEYYAGKSIFVTGGTGFMGKVLLEKLLRSCPKIDRIYVLIRTKKGKCAKERLQSILEGHLFANSTPTALEKVIAISGDITEPKLGISPSDEDEIIDNVSVIFHAAATVKFDEDLADSIKMNVLGTRSILHLAKRIRSLSALVHVSTAYSHCYSSTEIEERFYPMPEGKYSEKSPQELIELCEDAKKQGQDITKDIIGIFPNTYTFTKAMGEQIIQDEAALDEEVCFKIVIVRPSIVVASWKEPFPGWVDNLNGPTGIIVAAGVGILRTIYAKRNYKADIMPVDIAINLMCALAWKVGTQTYNHTRSTNIPIYNCTSGSTAPFKWAQLEEFYNYLLKNPFENMLWYPYGNPMKSNFYYDRVCRILFQWIPAYFVDALIYIARLKPIQLVKITSKMTKAIEALEYFATREWSWDTRNVMLLYNELSYGDQSIYNFSFRNFADWSGFFENYGLGAREFVMKSDPITLDACRKKLKWFYVANQAIKLLCITMFYFLLSWLWKGFFH